MSFVVVEDQRGPAFHIIFHRPEVKNALNLDAIHALRGSLAVAAKSDASVVVISGDGGDFSSGGDIGDMVERRGKAVATYERLRAGLSGIVEAIVGHEKPVIAVVDGVCMGAGAGVALACDAVLATERSMFGFPFVKVGLVPDTATSWILPHAAGLQNARRLLLTGESVYAPEAKSMGLVTKVVFDAAALKVETEAWIKRFQGLPTSAIRDAKRLILEGMSNSISHSLAREAMTQGLRFTTHEHAKAVDAFLANRKA
jgi:2-(1,2-epoxy-1,2-dihydrophenyl)acetyl-CoA isomerase